MVHDVFYMKQALALARQAARSQEVPIGAVVVDAYGEIVGRGFNQTEMFQQVSHHAELRALAEAGAATGNWRLKGATLYVTLQPCLMCLGAAAVARIQRIVYAAPSPLFGVPISIVQELGPTYQTILYEQHDVCAQESQALLQSFFAVKREGSLLS